MKSTLVVCEFQQGSISASHDFMKTTVIGSQKDSSGKTMLAAHLAVEAERAGETFRSSSQS